LNGYHPPDAIHSQLCPLDGQHRARGNHPFLPDDPDPDSVVGGDQESGVCPRGRASGGDRDGCSRHLDGTSPGLDLLGRSLCPFHDRGRDHGHGHGHALVLGIGAARTVCQSGPRTYHGQSGDNGCSHLRDCETAAGDRAEHPGGLDLDGHVCRHGVFFLLEMASVSLSEPSLVAWIQVADALPVERCPT
jgi:hypothetical protein